MFIQKPLIAKPHGVFALEWGIALRHLCLHERLQRVPVGLKQQCRNLIERQDLSESNWVCEGESN